MRARIALWAHEGHSNTVIARELGVSVQTVCLWRKRIARQGVQGIREGERSGRPPRITHEARLQLIALACGLRRLIDNRSASTRFPAPEHARDRSRGSASGAYAVIAPRDGAMHRRQCRNSGL
nr:helix-turn-helix domain-containing protein [Burkholderia sp. ABCPW 14]